MWPAAVGKLCPPPILTAGDPDGSVSMTRTASLPPRPDTESLSAQWVKKVSSSNKEYSELRGFPLLLDFCCCCVLETAGELVSGALSRTATTLLQSSDTTGADWGGGEF